MVEVDDQDWMAIADYIKNEIPDTFDIGNAPDDAKNKYTEILQRINGYGPEGSDTSTTAAVDQGVAAPA